jgi:hypothetical protein
VNLFEQFNSVVDLNGRFIVARQYYGKKVSLYSLPGFYVEVAFNPQTLIIERVESTTSEINKFLPFIELQNLLIT